MTPNEELARYVHTAWAEWVHYLIGHCFRLASGDMIIPEAEVARWLKYAVDSYEQLPENEKLNYRSEALKIQKIFVGEDGDD